MGIRVCARLCEGHDGVGAHAVEEVDGLVKEGLKLGLGLGLGWGLGLGLGLG